jgi:hypothetical protein
MNEPAAVSRVRAEWRFPSARSRRLGNRRSQKAHDRGTGFLAAQLKSRVRGVPDEMISLLDFALKPADRLRSEVATWLRQMGL